MKKLSTKNVFLLLEAANNVSISQIARKTNKAKSTIYRGFQTLLRKGLIEKRFKSYYLTAEGNNALTKSSYRGAKYATKSFRAVMFFKVKILRKSQTYERDMEKVFERVASVKGVRANNGWLLNQSLMRDFYFSEQVRVRATNKSFSFYLTDIYDTDLEFLTKRCVKTFFEAMQRAEDVFKVVLQKDLKVIPVFLTEYAHESNVFARLLWGLGFKEVFFRDEYGYKVAWVDGSKGAELEAHEIENLQLLNRHIVSMATDPHALTPSELSAEVRKLKEKLK